MPAAENITIAVVIPAYNQQDTISKVVGDWLHTLGELAVNFQIHVYDDGSTDETPAILEALATNHSEVFVHRQPNRGHGPTIRRGYLDNVATDWIVQVDSDDEVDASEFRSLWTHSESHDFVVAHRRARELSWSRAMITAGARALLAILYGSKVGDPNAPFRLMRVDAFHPAFSSIPEGFFAPNLALTGYASMAKLRTREVVVPHRTETSRSRTGLSLRIFRGAILSPLQLIRHRLGLGRRHRQPVLDSSRG